MPSTIGSVKNGLIAFIDNDTAGNANIFVISPDGSGKTQVTTGLGAKSLPCWSPDGNSLVYVKQNSVGTQQDIYIVNSDGSNDHLVTSNAICPAWSPDAKLVAYTTATSGKKEIWSMTPDGGNQVQLTRTPGNFVAANPSYSPDGKSIVYVRSDSGSTNASLWIMNADGSNQRQLTTGHWFNYDANGNVINTADDANDPLWSADNVIAFWAGVEQQPGQVWTINPDGTGRTQLTHVPAGISADEPAWSPDATQLLYSTNLRSGSETWLMNADGSDQHFLTRNAGFSAANDAAWQPAAQQSASAASSTGGATPSVATVPASPAPSTGDPIANQLNQLYAQVLGRNPDSDGLATYGAALRGGLSPLTIRQYMAASAEARGLLERLYYGVLGRAIDDGGRSTYSAALSRDTNLSDIKRILAQSPESQDKLKQVYRDVLGREADVGGLATYTSELADGASTRSLAQVRGTIAHSPEAQSVLTASFRTLMGRPPATAELVGIEETLASAGQTRTALQSALSAVGSAAVCALYTAPIGDAVLTAAATAPTLFVFGDIAFGKDTVSGFDPTRDTIQLPRSLVADLATLRSDTSAAAGGALITIDPSRSILVGGVASAALGAGNFIIA